MANTKRTVRKDSLGNMPSRVKMINLSNEKVSPAVRKMVNNIDNELKTQSKMSNIPVFKLLGANTLTAESFFLNHMDYEAVLGENVDILDRMMMSAICSTLTKDILWSMDQAKVSYVGVWDNYTIYNILAAIVTFMKHDEKDEKYLTALQYTQISQEDLDKLNPATYMPFSEYNPNRFAEQMILIRKVAVDTMAGIISNKLPKAFMSSTDQPLGVRLYNSYVSMMKDDMTAMLGETPAQEFLSAKATERAVRKFTDYFEKPFLTMLTLFLKESGLSDNVINMALGLSRIHIIFDDPTPETTTGDINIIYSMVSEAMPEGIEPIKVSFTVSIEDAVRMAISDPNTIAKSRREAFGKTIRTLILQTCTYVINVYTKLMAYNNAQKNETTETATSGYIAPVEEQLAPEQDDVGEMDIDDLTKLLT